jgi:hypothetical protein
MLNETKIRSAKPRDRAFKLYDERGLFLLVTPTGVNAEITLKSASHVTFR